MSSISSNKKIAVLIGIFIIFITSIDLLITRQLLPYDNNTQSLMFISTVLIGYGIGSWILLEYTHRVSKEIRKKSHFCNIMHWSVIIIQFSLFGILLIMLILGTTNHFLSRTVFAISSTLATIIMIAISFKFFSWYKASKYRTHIVLFYAIGTLTLAISIAEDAGTKLLMVQIIQEKTIEGSPLQTAFLYKSSEKYDGQIVYKEVKSDVTILYVVPNSLLDFYNMLNSIIIPIGFVFRWIASTMLLRNLYRKMTKIPISFWIILSIPLIIYLIGKMPGFFAGESLAGIDEAYRFYFRILFRAGTIAGNILFGLAFFIVAKNLPNSKLKDFLILAGIGDTLAGIALSTSAIEPTYGVAAHSLVLLSSYLFTLGLYSSAISISSDLKLRQSIKESAIESSKLLVSIGSAQITKELEKKVMAVAYTEKERLEKHTGIQSSLTELDMKQYLSSVLKEIKIIQNFDDIIKKGNNILLASSEFVICSKSSGLRLAYNNYFETYQKIMNKQKNKEHEGIRLVTSILNKDDVEIVYKFLNIGVNIRHIKNIPPIEFAVSEKEMIATILKTEDGQAFQNLLTTNEQAYKELFVSIFEELWKNGIDAKYKINDIEQGVDSQGIDIIQNPELVQKITFDLIKLAKKEIVAIFATANAFHRQEYAGTFQLLKERVQAANINARILVPGDNSIKNIIEDLERKQLVEKINIRLIEQSIQTKVSIMVADNKYSIVTELKDDSKQTTEEAIGLATYSDSKSTVLSYSAIFENLWKQTELYEKLQMHENLQKEFINIAAHELRTPIQPILGIANILKNNLKEDNQKELIDIITRNAKRLKKLAEDILEVSKIEGNSINLYKERFNLKEIILDNISNYKNNSDIKNINFECKLDDNIRIYADINSINRVISNLINNSIKFIDNDKEGDISIIAEKKRIAENNGKDSEIVTVCIKDTGRGIDPEIMPRLFTKFTSRSFQGTGLGLYICKSIVEAHGGKIWAENNKDGIGATFNIILPMDKS